VLNLYEGLKAQFKLQCVKVPLDPNQQLFM